jgi:hypothetical protein
MTTKDITYYHQNLTEARQRRATLGALAAAGDRRRWWLAIRLQLWQRERLSWAVVAMVVFATLSVVATDFAWRFIKMQFETFLICAFFGVSAAALTTIAVAGLVTRASRVSNFGRTTPIRSLGQSGSPLQAHRHRIT